MKANTYKILFVILAIVSLNLICVGYKNTEDKNVVLEKVHLKNKLKKDSLAILLQQTDKTYKELDSDVWPTEGYKFNQILSGCIDSKGKKIENSLAYDEKNQLANVSTGGTTFCYLYFDIVSNENYCADREITNFSDCLLISDSKSYDVEDAKQNISAKDASSSTTAGIYKTIDEQGDTYFYRGNVNNNYVLYAGYVWRIVRINGSGSIKLIYSGESTSSTGNDTAIEQGAYSVYYREPTFLGYKYGKNFVFAESEVATEYKSFDDEKTICFSKGYTKTDDGYLMLDFSSESNYLCTVLADDYDNVIQNYPYTVERELINEKSLILHQLLEYKGERTVISKYHSYRSKDYQSTLSNEIDSNIKLVVDSWYEQNILNKNDSFGQSLSNYLVDEVFCNDRGLYDGTGYKIETDTKYSSYNRMKLSTPSLMCNQNEDEFSVTNGNLNYPIGLLTADEAMFAGGKLNTSNTDFYLYTGANFWTMTPFVFRSYYLYGYMGLISYEGAIYGMNYTAIAGIRPVINLKESIKVVSGNGTANYPYEISLN